MTKAQQRKISREITKMISAYLKQAVDKGIPDSWNAVELWWLAEHYSKTAFSRRWQPKKRVREFNNELLTRGHL